MKENPIPLYLYNKQHLNIYLVLSRIIFGTSAGYML